MLHVKAGKPSQRENTMVTVQEDEVSKYNSVAVKHAIDGRSRRLDLTTK